MKEYHKIQTVYKRDPETKFKNLLDGDYSMPEFEYLEDTQWLWTEKIDGTNIRVIWHGGDNITFEGKTDNSQIQTILYKKLQQSFTKERFEMAIDYEPDSNICLYGEGYGAKIQKSGGNYISDGVDFILFDVKIDDWWLKWEDVKDIANKLKILHVPIVGEGTLLEGVELVENTFHSIFGTFNAEGLVMRPKIDLFTRRGDRIITKIKTKDFKRV